MSTPSSCPMCGYLLGATSCWAYLEMCLYYAQTKSRARWPRRKCVFGACPECNHRIMLAQQVSRDCVEFA